MSEDDTIQEALRIAYWDDPALVVCGKLPTPFYVNDFVDAVDNREVTPMAANNSLLRLVRLGLLDRERDDPETGGKRYRYRLNAAGRVALTKGAG